MLSKRIEAKLDEAYQAPRVMNSVQAWDGTLLNRDLA